jgi:hypothetical protein
LRQLEVRLRPIFCRSPYLQLAAKNVQTFVIPAQAGIQMRPIGKKQGS